MVGLNLAAYLQRIGLSGTPDPAAVQHAHAVAIPFENLDPQRGVPVSLDLGALQDKLVTARRGGYCFEHNLLLAAALRELGHQVDLFLARVRFGRPAGTISPRTHLVLALRGGSADQLIDAGFGSGTPLAPLPLTPGGPRARYGWRYRIAEEGSEWVLQAHIRGTWADLYAFVPEPVPHVDIETSNWFTATHPRSPFVTGLFVTRQFANGARLTLRGAGSELTLTHESPRQWTVDTVDRAMVPELLARRFALPGWGLDGAGRVVPATDAALRRA